MTPVKVKIGAWLLICAVFYVFGSFVAATFNVNLWHPGGRFFYAILMLIIGCIIAFEIK